MAPHTTTTDLGHVRYWPESGSKIAVAAIAADMTICDQLDTVRCTSQWYFMCPRQDRYVSTLWSPPRQRFFAGRQSWSNMAYLSQFHTKSGRSHYMANKLCDFLGEDASEEWDVPSKAKGMRWATYERLTEKYVNYREQAGILPWEYRYVGDVV